MNDFISNDVSFVFEITTVLVWFSQTSNKTEKAFSVKRQYQEGQVLHSGLDSRRSGGARVH